MIIHFKRREIASLESIFLRRYYLMRENKLDVLLVIRSDIAGYPPSLNFANRLANASIRTGILDLKSNPERACELDPSIERISVHPQWDSRRDRPPNLGVRAFRLLRFSAQLRYLIHQRQPSVIVAYDPLAIQHVPCKLKNTRIVYHFHELCEEHPMMGFATRRSLQTAKDRSKHVDKVVFSDTDRARIFQDEANLSKRPDVIMNCPRTIHSLDNLPSTENLSTQLGSNTPIVGYLGSVGRCQGLEAAMESTVYWPKDAQFVLVGPYSNEMREQLEQIASTNGTISRVHFLGGRPHNQALALASQFDVGLSLIQPLTRNWLYSSGAVNKRFEYMAVGVPQISNNGPGISELLENGKCGLVVDSYSAKEIGDKVSFLLGEATMRRDMGDYARELHINKYNCEKQFEPLVSWISQVCER